MAEPGAQARKRRRDLVAVVARSNVFDGVSRDDLRAIKDELSRVEISSNEVLVDRGEAAEDLYLLVEGRLEVVLSYNGDSVPVATLEPGDTVGEIAVLAGDTRACMVRSTEPSELVRLSAAGLRQILEEHPEAGDGLARRGAERLRRTQLVEHLTRLFEELPTEAMEVVEELSEWVALRGGERLFAQGDDGDAVYLVVSGRLRAVTTDPDAGERELGEITRGELVGEMALLGDTARTATVHAVRDSQLVRFGREAYHELMAHYPRAGLLMAQTMIGRVHAGRPRREANRMSMVVVPASPSVDLGRFMPALMEALGPDAQRLSSSTIDEELGVPGISQVDDDGLGAIRLGVWLEEMEERHRFLVLEVDEGSTSWSERALRWADRVLVVADATGDPDPTPTERDLWRQLANPQHPKLSLVLVHPEGTELPSGTARWIDARPLLSHYHVRAGAPAMFDRLARLVTGEGVTLVLGGGGARGFAHLGVMEALHEHGIPVDAVGGSSIGAVMAGGHGMGWSPEHFRSIALERFTNLLDYTPPTAALLRGERITDGMRTTLGDVDIEDLWVPYFAVATDLTDAHTVYQDRGPLVRAMRASVAIPGMLPPVPVDGHLLADGGVLDNVPVEEMRRRNPMGTVIAVDVAPAEGPTARVDYGLSVSGWKAWRDRRTGSGPPSVLTTIVRSTIVASARDRNRVVREEIADLYIDLSVDGGGLLDFSAADEIASTARSSVSPVLRSWKDETLTESAVTVDAGTRRTMMPDQPRRAAWAGVLTLTLRDLQLRATRFGAVIGGTAVVLALLFLMVGLVEQFNREPKDTVAALGAEAWLVREGAAGAFTAQAAIPTAAAAEVDPGLSPTPVIVSRHTIDDGEAIIPVVLLGYRAAGPLGVPDVVDGRLPAGPDEITVDDSAGLAVDETTVIGGRELQVVGLTDRTTLFAGMPVVFMRYHAAQELSYRGLDLASAVLVDRVPEPEPDGLDALSADAIAEDAMRPLERSVSSITLVQVLLWFVAAMIIGTMVYVSALERRRDVAVLKAVGGTTRQLGASIALQGILIAALAAGVASALQAVLAPVFPLEVAVPNRAFLQVPVLAVIVAMAAGAFGMRSAVRTDPALAFSGPGS